MLDFLLHTNNPWVYLFNILFDETGSIGCKALPRCTKIWWRSWEMQFFTLLVELAGFVSFLVEYHFFPIKEWPMNCGTETWVFGKHFFKMNYSSLQGKQVAAFVANDKTGTCREKLKFWKNSATMDLTVSRSLKLYGFKFILLLTFLRNHNLVLLLLLLLLSCFSGVPLCATP